MLEKIKGLRTSLLWPIIALLPRLAAAEVPQDIEGITRKLCDVMAWFYTFALIVGIIFIILAAFKYMTAGGDAEKFSGAHRALIYGAIGIAVAILAKGVPFIVGSFLGAEENVLNACP